MIARSILFVTIVVAFISKTTVAFSSGAAGCLGEVVVGGPHVDSDSKPITKLDWAATKLVLKVNNKVVKPGDVITVTQGAKTNIELTAGSKKFKGFLFRLTAPPEFKNIKVFPSVSVINADNCVGTRIGLTHGEGSEKTKAIGQFSIAKIPEEVIDFKVVVVFKNADSGAEHAISDYTLKVQAAKPCVPKKCSNIQNFFGCTTKFCD